MRMYNPPHPGEVLRELRGLSKPPSPFFELIEFLVR